MSAQDRVLYWQRRARDAERLLEFEKENNESTPKFWPYFEAANRRQLLERGGWLT